MIPTSNVILDWLNVLAGAEDIPTPGPATHYGVDGPLDNLTVGVPAGRNLQALDDNNLVDVTYNGTVDASFTDPNLEVDLTSWADGLMFIQLTQNTVGDLALICFDQDNPSITCNLPTHAEL
jgi:hypothetical protein